DLMQARDEGGFTSVVATNCEQEYRRSVVLGDRLSVSSSIESVSTEKQTGLGIGHFITTLLAFTDAAGEPVATMRFRILKFRPARASPRLQFRARRPPHPKSPGPCGRGPLSPMTTPSSSTVPAN